MDGPWCVLMALLVMSNCGVCEGGVKGGGFPTHQLGCPYRCQGFGRDHTHEALQLSQPNSAFALRLYNQVAAQPEHQNKNVFLSPLSLSLALAALSLGARGDTYTELVRGLALPDGVGAAMHQGFCSILQSLNANREVELRAGSALFIRDDFTPRPEFVECLKSLYRSKSQPLNFARPSEAVAVINNYVEQKTNGKIKSVVEQLDSETVLFLVIYVHFKGNWKVPFDPKMTTDGWFKANGKTSVQVKMMSAMGSYGVYRDQGLSSTVLQLPYAGSMVMMLVLPDGNINTLERLLRVDHIDKWQRGMTNRGVVINVPKFSLETSYSLKEILIKMGMSRIFSRMADFDGISHQPTFVSKVVQKATLDVDETGTTAAAATGVGMVLRSFKPSEVIAFDRPFMLFIIDKDINSILFMGKVVNPAQKSC